MPEEVFIALAAFVVGTLVGITGVGGGALMTPALIIFFGVSPIVAIATDLLFATVTKIFASAMAVKTSSVSWGIVRKMWLGSIPGTILGVMVLIYLSNELVLVINLLLVLLLLATAFSLLFSSGVSKTFNPTYTIAGGGLIGFSVATTSVGAGALGMVLLRSVIGDAEPKRLVVTDIIHAIPIALLAGVSYMLAGFFDTHLLVNMLIGSIPGAVFGLALLNRVNAGGLRKMLAIMLILVSVAIAAKSLGLI